MKKILALLVSVLCTISVFGQSHFEYSRTNTVTQVGDTLIVKFEYFKGTDADGNLMPDATLTQFDFQYNNKLLSYIGHDWNVSSTSAQKARNSWNGYKFSEDADKEILDYDGQYQSWLSGDAAYTTNADWSVERITIQDATGYGADTDYHRFVTYKFKIKDKANTNYTNYSEILNGNWANYKQSDGTQIDVTKGAANHKLSLSNIQGGDAGDVTISVSSNVITNNIGNGADFGYTIYTKSDYDAGITENTTVISSGTFDASGEATVQGLENDVQYVVFVHIDASKTYLDEAVTVSDLALVFQQAIGTDINGGGNTFDYAIQTLLGNVVSPSGIDFNDSYEILAHLQGVTTNNQNFISKTGEVFNVSGIKSTFGDQDTNGNPTFNSVIQPTDNVKAFAFSHAMSGDVNFSHSFQPTSTNATMSTAKTSSVELLSSAKYNPIDANIDLISELVDGKVIFSINSQVLDMVGSQFNIVYDKTRLVLENVVFDTGNDMTNFANHREEVGKINIGSFDQNFNSTVKVGTPYKLIFIPTVELNNTSGLITFKVNEGVKSDGTQINFILN